MRDFKSGNRSRDRRDSRRPLLYDAVCDECGRDCQVPFKPSGGKPVYCSDCFEKKGGSDSNRSRGRRDFPRRSFGGDRSISQLVEKIEVLNTRLDTIIDLLSSIGQKKSGVDKNTEALTPVEKKDTKEKKLKEK